MPISDIWIVVRWWGALFLIGAAAFPITKQLFSGRDEYSWVDQGYLFAKAVGFALITWIVYVLGMAHLAPFTPVTIIVATGTVFLGGILIDFFVHGRTRKNPTLRMGHVATYLLEEVFFFGLLLLWVWIKAHEPSIRGLEKFMDYGFMQSIANSAYFPPADMWYPPDPINYYYFGHLVTALLTKLSGLDLAYTFNLMLCTLFALTFSMSFGIGRYLLRKYGRWIAVAGGVFTAWLVSLAGNMQTIYAFTKGYSGDAVVPFWQLLWAPAEFFARLPDGWGKYWYANATRFIPFTIHEFPSYSFVVSDVHGHVLSLPFALLAIALLIVIFGKPLSKDATKFSITLLIYPVFYGFLVGVLLMTNALDGPIYGGLFGILFVLTHWREFLSLEKHWATFITPLLAMGVAALMSSLPFLSHFSSFVSGLAVNCPPSFLADSKVGPLLFEGVEKCQKSPLWEMWLLWGFFWFCGAVLIFIKTKKISQWRNVSTFWNTHFTQEERLLLVFYFFSIALIIFPEFFYFKDIYPQHFRSNTMFKLGYQAFILWSILSGYTIFELLFSVRSGIRDIVKPWVRRLFIVLLLPQLVLISLYPSFSVRSYFGELRTYEGIYGLNWFGQEYPDDFAALYWLKAQPKEPNQNLIEADGDSYTDYERFSAFSGIPTPVGWAVHEWLWRGSYDAVAPRREEVRIVYESGKAEDITPILDRYHVRYIMVGTMERQKFSDLKDDVFQSLGKVVFQSHTTVIYDRYAK